jgi:hypothetical protein
MLFVAFPQPRIRQISNVGRAAGGAFHHAIGPAEIDHEPVTILVIIEEFHGLKKRFGSIIGVHHGQHSTLK